MPKKPAVDTNLVYLIGLVALVALVGVAYLYVNGSKASVGRPIAVLDESAPAPTAVVQGGQNCVVPIDGMDFNINNQVVDLCYGTYNLPNGIRVSGSGITLNCGTENVKFVGSGGASTGLFVTGPGNAINGCEFSGYQTGAYVDRRSNVFSRIYVHDNLGIGFKTVATANEVRFSKIMRNGGSGYSSSGGTDSNIVADSTISDNVGRGLEFVGGSNYNSVLRNTIENGFPGIYFESHTNTVSNNTINNSSVGIYFDTSSNDNTVSFNSLSGNGQGIKLWESSSNTISQNTISGGSEAVVIQSSWEKNSQYNVITGNRMASNYEYAIQVYSYGDHTTISDNTITNSSFNDVFGAGIRMDGEYGTLSGNLISYSGGDGMLPGCHNNIINNTIINNMGSGITIMTYPQICGDTFIGNTITGNGYSGLHIGGGMNILSRNIISNNGYGLSFIGTGSNTISENTVTNNRHFGILLPSGSTNNDLSNNIVTGNSIGLVMSDGSSGTDLANNTFCANTNLDVNCTNSGPTTFSNDQCTLVSATGCGFTACPATCPGGNVSVSSSPSSASVYLDSVYKSLTPNTISGVSPGSHQISILKSGYATYTGTVMVNAGQTASVSVTLQPNATPTPCPPTGCPTITPKPCIINPLTKKCYGVGTPGPGIN